MGGNKIRDSDMKVNLRWTLTKSAKSVIIRGNPRFRRYPEYKESGVEWIGEIPKGWEVLKVKHVGYSNPSKTLSQNSLS